MDHFSAKYVYAARFILTERRYDFVISIEKIMCLKTALSALLLLKASGQRWQVVPRQVRAFACFIVKFLLKLYAMPTF